MTPTTATARDPVPPPPIMGEWDLGLGWVLAILFAVPVVRSADTQHARPPRAPRDDRFPDEPPTRPAVRGGWPPGARPAARRVRPDSRPPTPLSVPSA